MTRAKARFSPALVEMEDALSPGFIIEELEDGRYTVLVPSVPTPAAGALFILPRERVHPLDVPFTQAVTVISKWGAGAGVLARGVTVGSRHLTVSFCSLALDVSRRPR